MIYGYKKISIIYGGKGSEYAKLIENKLNELHYEYHYPIKTMCINSDWVSNTILTDVINAIKDSDLIYIVFTLDDFGCKKDDFIAKGTDALIPRLRQNVLIELGMALAVTDMDINKIKVVADFEKSDLGNDFPSDIRDALNIKTFNNNNFNSVLDSVEQYAINIFSRNSTKDIIYKIDEIFDFENVFDEYEKYEYIPNKRIKTLRDILNMWKETVTTLDFVEERFVFCLERLKSFPIFGNGSQLVKWIIDFQKHIIIDSNKDNKTLISPNIESRSFLKIIKNIIDLCLKYTVIKSDDQTENDEFEYRTIANEFEDVYEQVKVYLNNGGKINPIALFCLYEYYGLTEMRIYKANNSDNINKLEHINKIINLYVEGAEIAENIDSDFNAYSGYITFNLGRAYFYRYKLTNEETDKKLFHKYMEKTLLIRKKWKDSSELPECYLNALSYEYFYANSEYIKMLYETGDLDRNSFILRTDKIIESIDGYISRDEELSKLCKIKNVCISMKTGA